MSADDYDSHDKSMMIASHRGPPHDRRREVDVKAMLDAELLSQTGVKFTMGLLPPGNLNKIESSPSKYGVVDRFFYFDSDVKQSDSDLSVGKLVYNISTLNQNQTVDNIIQIDIGEFFIPVVPASVDFPEYFFFKRLMIFIEEMISSAIFAQNNERYHFELGIQAAGIANELYDIGFSKYIFTRPFKTMDRISFRFKAPTKVNFKNVAFLQDTYAFNAIPGVAGGVFGGATIATTIPHGLTVGTDVSIFISNFASNIGNIDSLINGPNGFLVRVINTTVLEFRAPGVVGFDFLTLAVPTPGQLLIGYRHIAFTMRFRSLTDGDTNTIVAV